METCSICGGTHKTVDHAGDDVTHPARHDRRLSKEEDQALWKALYKSTKLIHNGRLIDTNKRNTNGKK